MRNFAPNVVHFNREVLGIEQREKGLLNRAELELTKKSLEEEVMEFEVAHGMHDYIGAVDALIDLMYFAVGGLHKMGVTVDEMERCAEAVHSCNMTKRKGVVLRRGDGSAADATKPCEWIGPEQLIAEILGGKQA